MASFQQMSIFARRVICRKPRRTSTAGPSVDIIFATRKGIELCRMTSSYWARGIEVAVVLSPKTMCLRHAMSCRKASRQSQYGQRPFEASSDDQIEIFESQRDQGTKTQNEPEIGEGLTCCISCRYFGFRSELMMRDGNPTGGNVFDDQDEAHTSIQTIGTSGIGSIQCRVGEDGRKEDEALGRSTGRSGGDNR